MSFALSPTGQGILYGLTATLIWSGHSIASSLGLAAGLSAYDLTAVRIMTNMLLFLPVILLSLQRQKTAISPLQGIVLAILAGASFSVVVTSGLIFAPVTHSAAISLGCVPLLAFLLLLLSGRTRFNYGFLLALTLLIGGIGLITQGSQRPDLREDYWIGDLLFLGGSLMWASYAVLGRIWQVDAITGVAATNFFSAPYLLWYFVWQDSHLLQTSLWQLLFQVLYQGVLVGGVALICYIRSVALLGVEKGALFTALAPVGVMLLGIAVLGYQPVNAEIIGITLVTAGMIAALLQNTKTE